MHEMALVDSVHSDCFQRSNRTVILTASALLFEMFVATDDKRSATGAFRPRLFSNRRLAVKHSGS
jgi:hypothetical protein